MRCSFTKILCKYNDFFKLCFALHFDWKLKYSKKFKKILPMLLEIKKYLSFAIRKIGRSTVQPIEVNFTEVFSNRSKSCTYRRRRSISLQQFKYQAQSDIVHHGYRTECPPRPFNRLGTYMEQSGTRTDQGSSNQGEDAYSLSLTYTHRTEHWSVPSHSRGQNWDLLANSS